MGQVINQRMDGSYSGFVNVQGVGPIPSSNQGFALPTHFPVYLLQLCLVDGTDTAAIISSRTASRRQHRGGTCLCKCKAVQPDPPSEKGANEMGK